MISGSFSDTDSSVLWGFENAVAESYTLTYKGGGPSGAAMTGVIPVANLYLANGEVIKMAVGA
jgi:hypothetical protein